MDLMELHKSVSICQSETDAFNYLFQKKKELKGILCPRCKSQEFYLMSLGRIRCINCKTDYNPLIDTDFIKLRISCVSGLLLIKLFELEISAHKAGIQLGLSCPTTLKGFDILRSVILREFSRSD